MKTNKTSIIYWKGKVVEVSFVSFPLCGWKGTCTLFNCKWSLCPNYKFHNMAERG